MNDALVLAMGSLLLAAATICICICRLDKMKRDALLRVRTEYASWVGGSVFAALGPLMGDWPGLPTLALQVCCIGGLLCSGHAWRNDIPESAKGTS